MPLILVPLIIGADLTTLLRHGCINRGAIGLRAIVRAALACGTAKRLPFDITLSLPATVLTLLHG